MSAKRRLNENRNLAGRATRGELRVLARLCDNQGIRNRSASKLTIPAED
jgi:hypothetical protein